MRGPCRVIIKDRGGVMRGIRVELTSLAVLAAVCTSCLDNQGVKATRGQARQPSSSRDGSSIDLPPPDTQAPFVTFTAPAPATTVSGGSVTISVTATDNVAVVGVQFKLDGTSVGAEMTSAPYSLSLDSRLYSNGAHQ